jgi:hypothetical protein
MKRTVEQYKEMIADALDIIEDIQSDDNTEYESDFDKALTDMIYTLSDKLDELEA